MDPVNVLVLILIGMFIGCAVCGMCQGTSNRKKKSGIEETEEDKFKTELRHKLIELSFALSNPNSDLEIAQGYVSHMHQDVAQLLNSSLSNGMTLGETLLKITEEVGYSGELSSRGVKILELTNELEKEEKAKRGTLEEIFPKYNLLDIAVGDLPILNYDRFIHMGSYDEQTGRGGEGFITLTYYFQIDKDVRGSLDGRVWKLRTDRYNPERYTPIITETKEVVHDRFGTYTVIKATSILGHASSSYNVHASTDSLDFFADKKEDK